MQAPVYFVSSCSGSTSGVVDFGTHIPADGEVYALIFADGNLENGCYTVVSGGTDAIDVVVDFQLFESCDYCVNGVPVDGTYEYTLECCDPISGTTGPGPVVPHPEFGSGLGVSIQLNAVTLGGLNGLNN